MIRPYDGPNLSDRVALVTGASRGIGAAVTEALLAAGASVVMSVRACDPAMKKRAKALREKFGRPLLVHVADVNQADAMAAQYQRVFEEFRRLDILVNSAGVMESAPIGLTDAEMTKRIIDTNLGGTIVNCRHAARLMMRKKQGSIVNLSSIVAELGSSGQSVYAASKAGVVGLTKSLAREMGPHGVRVNAVAPGFIDTDMTANFDISQREAIQSKTALQRLGNAQDVANVVTFLASDAAAFVTGQTLGVDGGLVI